MKRFFVHDNGRLKTGRVALLVFVAAIAGCSLVFYLGKPADKVLVAVKHVFEAEEAPSPEPAPETTPEPASEPAPEMAPKPEPADQARETVAASESPEAPESKGAPRSHAAPGAAAPEKPIAEKADGSTGPADAVGPAYPAAGKPADEQGPHEPVSQSIRFDPLPGIPVNEERPKAAGPAGEAVLDAADYAGVHNSWRASGVNAAGEGGIPLRIENLKAVHPLLQMKAVAVRGDSHLVDLSDGTRIAGDALSMYSGTCFLVENPFEQWGDALKRAGFQPGSNIEVRYYMYDSIRNAIFARAAHAIDCCRRKGLIPTDVSHDAVDVLGRAYAIKRQGGGNFGVFVPVRIDLPDGRAVPVDPSCFAGSPDIDHLMAAGQLR